MDQINKHPHSISKNLIQLFQRNNVIGCRDLFLRLSTSQQNSLSAKMSNFCHKHGAQSTWVYTESVSITIQPSSWLKHGRQIDRQADRQIARLPYLMMLCLIDLGNPNFKNYVFPFIHYLQMQMYSFWIQCPEALYITNHQIIVITLHF